MDRSTDPIDAMDRSKRSGAGATKNKNSNSTRDPIDAVDRCRRSGAGANKNKNSNPARDESTEDSIAEVDRGRRSGANETKNGDSTRVPDLAASLGAMGLRDLSPQPPEQQDQRVGMLLLLQHRRSNAAAAAPPARQFRPIPLMEGLQVARQYWPQPQPQRQQQPYPWEEIGSSGGGRYVSLMGAADAASNPSAWYNYDRASGTYLVTQSQNGGQHHFVPASGNGNSWGQQPCALGATASQYLQYPQIASLLPASSSTNTGQYQYQYQPVAAPGPASSSTNNDQYQYQYPPVAAPVAASYNTNTGQYQYQPMAAPVAASSSTNTNQYQYQYQHYATPNNISQQYQYQHYAATPNNAGVDDWSVPGDDWDQGVYQPPRAAPAVEPPLQGMTLEETRSRLLQAPIELNMVTLPESPEHAVALLGEGGDKIRLNVLDGVRRRVHDFMDSRLGHEVFVALLRASARARRPREVQAIVHAAVDGHKLLRLTKHDYGEKCLRELMVATAPYPDLCKMLVHRFLDERVLTHDKGDQVLRLCFATMSYEHTKLLVRTALQPQIFAAMAQSGSPAGSKCLVECFDNAMGDEFSALQAILFQNAFFLATGDYSNYFVQHVLEHGDEETKLRLVRQLMQHALPLSLDRSGSYVVETCFQKTGLLHLVLAVFLRFNGAQLVELVRGRCSNYVVHRLLDAAKDRFPAETVMLARRIDRLPADTSAAVFDEKVKRVVTKILSRRPVYHYR